MAQQKRNAPKLPAEAYQLAEMYHLGQPLKLYRANFTNGLGCVLAGPIMEIEKLLRVLPHPWRDKSRGYAHPYCRSIFLNLKIAVPR